MANKNKYYAVKRGRSPGIYRTWEEANASVSGFKGAVLKSFKSRIDAELFLGNKNIVIPVPQEEEEKEHPIIAMSAYVDGSYNVQTHEYGAGVVMLKDDVIVDVYSQKGRNKEYEKYCNVAGELLAAMMAVQYCKTHGVNHLTIYHDYNGIENIVNSETLYNPLSIAYQNFIRIHGKSINITYKKVASHSNNKYNNLADTLSRCGCNIPAIKMPVAI